MTRKNRVHFANKTVNFGTDIVCGYIVSPTKNKYFFVRVCAHVTNKCKRISIDDVVSFVAQMIQAAKRGAKRFQFDGSS